MEVFNNKNNVIWDQKVEEGELFQKQKDAEAGKALADTKF